MIEKMLEELIQKNVIATENQKREVRLTLAKYAFAATINSEVRAEACRICVELMEPLEKLN